MALLAPLNLIDSLLLKFFSEQTVNYVVWPFIQIGAVVTITALWVSYEVSMGLAIIGALMFARTLSLSGIVAAQQSDSIWFFVYQPIGFMIFLISGIAENNRAPFDLAEAESELVAGFHTEYSGFRWSLFFMAEYAAMVVVTAVATTLYLGGWYFPFVY